MIITFIFSSSIFSQDLYIEKGFVIIHSSKDYSSALKIAQESSEKMKIDLDLRDYKPDSRLGLITDVECGCGIVHDYIARGHSDDGQYVSIEYSNMYEGFSTGYYIVIIASGRKDDKKLKESLVLAKEYYPDSYIKSTEVYTGCMH